MKIPNLSTNHNTAQLSCDCHTSFLLWKYVYVQKRDVLSLNLYTKISLLFSLFDKRFKEKVLTWTEDYHSMKAYTP